MKRTQGYDASKHAQSSDIPKCAHMHRKQGTSNPIQPGSKVSNLAVRKQIQWKFIPATSPTSWKDICKLGRNLDEYYKLNYIPRSHDSRDFYAKIDKSEIEANVQRWKNALVGTKEECNRVCKRVHGCLMVVHYLKAMVSRQWSWEDSYHLFCGGEVLISPSKVLVKRNSQ